MTLRNVAVLKCLMGTLGVALFIGLASFGVFADPYTDYFTASPTISSGGYHAETGTAQIGLVYSSGNSTFVHHDGDLGAGSASGTPGSFTIVSRNGNPFIFYELHIDTIDAVTISGTGPEPFTTVVPSTSVGYSGPGGDGKLVSSVTVSSSPELSVFIDDVHVAFDLTAPTLDSFERQLPLSQYTNADTLVFRATFDEDVQYVTTGDFTVSGTSATVTSVSVVSAKVYDLTMSDGDLAEYRGPVGVNLADGQNIADLSGNVLPAGEPATDETYVLDNTAPNVPPPSSSSHTVSVWSNDNTVDIAITGVSDEGGSGVLDIYVGWDQSTTWTPTEVVGQDPTWMGDTFTATSNGNWYFHITAIDDANNMAAIQHFGPFQIDTADPSVPTGIAPANGAYTNDTTPTFFWSDSADTGGSGLRTSPGVYRIVATGTPSAEATTNHSDSGAFITLAEGTFTWRVYAYDNAGNSSSTGDYTLYIDTTGPSVTVNVVDGSLFDGDNSSNVTFEFNEDVTGFTIADLTPTNGSLSSFASVDADSYTVTFTATDGIDATGSVSVAATYTDLAGNAGGTGSDTVAIDTENPTVVFSDSHPDLIVRDADTVIITTTFSENTTNAPTLSIDVSGGSGSDINDAFMNGANDSWTFMWNVPAGNSGETATVTVWAQDLPGNVYVGSDTIVYTIDNTAPTPTITTSPDPIMETALTQTVTVTYDESMDPATSPVVTLIGGNWGAQANVGWSTTIETNDTYTCTFLHNGTQEEIAAEVASIAGASGATDVAGNAENSDDSPGFEVDTQNPTATVTTDHTVLPGLVINENSPTLTVTVVYDEAMDQTTLPTITLPNGGDNWGAQTPVGGTGWQDAATYQATFTHDGTEGEEILSSAYADVANGSGATDLAGNAEEGDGSLPFDVDIVMAVKVWPDLVVIPMGDGCSESFLDRCLPLEEGEEPPMIGLRPLSAIYEIDEVITGRCSIRDLAGRVVRGSYIHVYIYSVDVLATPEFVELLDHWVVRYDHDTATYSFEVATSVLLPGYYDIYLSFPDGSSYLMRIQLVALAEWPSGNQHRTLVS